MAPAAAARAAKEAKLTAARAAKEAKLTAAREKAEAKLAAAREAKAKAAATRAARAEAAKQARAAAALAATEKPRLLRELGFKQLPAASRVFVRLSETPRFSIVEAGDKLIRIELPNTRVVRRNDTRFLDTSFFPGAVSMVTPHRSGSGTVVEIALKEKVAYQQHVEGDTLAIDFERPGAKSAAP